MRRGGLSTTTPAAAPEENHVEESTTSTTATTSTRFRSFFVLNRNRPWKQARTILWITVLVVLYGHLLFTSSWPHYNADQISKTNLETQQVFRKQQLERQALAEERRQERLEKRRKKLKQEHERYPWRNMMMQNVNNSTNTTTTSAWNTTTSTTMLMNHAATQRQRDALSRFVNFVSSMVVFFTVCMSVRVILRLCLFLQLSNNSQRQGTSSTRQRRRNNSREQRNTRFRNWVQDLNRQRTAQGERPLSMSSLRLVLREVRSDGNDYDALLNFSQESGDAIQALTSTMGATQEEIERCPERTLGTQDDLLRLPNNNSTSTNFCAVCLEPYQLHERVRTIPCFHTFHKECIDPWLAQKAICPVCKHPAVA